MNPTRWHELEFRHLEYALAVQRRQGFMQAALDLDLDQGFLSRQIQRLEAKLGFKLFDRSSRPLVVTPAGRDFLAKAEQILAQTQRAVTLGQETQAGQWGSLQVGINTSIANSKLPDIVQAFCQRFPTVDLVFHELASYDQIKQLTNHQIDVGFFHQHNFDALEDTDRLCFSSISILSEPLVLVLPEYHPAARRSPISLASLSGEKFVLPPRTLLYGLRGQIDELLQQTQCQPIIKQEAAWITTVLSLVAGGIGISLLPANVTQLQRQGVVYRPIQEASPTLNIVAVWLSNNPSATLRHFLDVLR